MNETERATIDEAKERAAKIRPVLRNITTPHRTRTRLKNELAVLACRVLIKGGGEAEGEQAAIDLARLALGYDA